MITEVVSKTSNRQKNTSRKLRVDATYVAAQLAVEASKEGEGARVGVDESMSVSCEMIKVVLG